MRKLPILSIKILAILVMFVVAPALTTTAYAEQLCGDHNRNGDVAASDALLLLQFAVGHPVEVACPAGLHCWDAEDNGLCDEVDDINQDGYCDMLDCQGIEGPMGPMGPMGQSGPMGGWDDHSSEEVAALQARVDALEALVATLQQLHTE